MDSSIPLKISIITVSFNSERTIANTIQSVISQNYPHIEYIVVDGASKDRTAEIINSYSEGIAKIISEPDKGMYDAMNKGILAATGDIVGILNSDDFFYDDQVISKVAQAFQDQETEATIGDIVFVKESSENEILRRYSSKKWTPAKFAWGYMPPHPSFFVKKSLFEKFGLYKTNFKIAADYELLIRFLLINKIKWRYFPLTTTKMRMGGLSTQGISSVITLNKEIARACRENGLYSNFLMIYSKYFFKPFEFLFK